MGQLQVEGALWHMLLAWPEEAKQSSAAGQFARLMQEATHTTAAKTATSPAEIHHMRYRILGGVADGVVCEISEQAGQIRLSVFVPTDALFHTITALSNDLIAQLKQAGFSLSVEVQHAEFLT